VKGNNWLCPQQPSPLSKQVFITAWRTNIARGRGEILYPTPIFLFAALRTPGLLFSKQPLYGILSILIKTYPTPQTSLYIERILPEKGQKFM
jgi:hypothetical protein